MAVDFRTPPISASTVRRSLELLATLTLREVRSQYKRTALGRLWSFINPLATIGIFSLVFATLMRIPIEPGTRSHVHVFALFLAAAIIPWNFISGGVMTGMNAIVSNGGLLGKVYFPRWIAVVATILSLTFTLVIELGVLVAVMAFVGGPRILLMIPAILALIVLAAVFVSGVALVMSVALVYFRDTHHFMALFMQVWFYVTPIVYPISLLVRQQAELQASGRDIPLRFIFGLNPAYRFTGAFRQAIYDYEFPSLANWTGCLVWAAAALALGILVFSKFSARLVEEL